ncbi:MAG TPA: glycosyltransferase family 9 protein, partial [Chloroflexota bacterium]|nr:glycosyltransferase family 9 protein [Chloroflexota bacterium]
MRRGFPARASPSQLWRDILRQPLLWALAAVLGRGPEKRRPVDAQREAPGRVLLVRPDHLGDLLFLTPAIRRLRDRWPEAEVICLVGPWGERILAGNPDVNRVVTFPFPWFDRQPRRSVIDPYRRLARAIGMIRNFRCDVALNFRSDFWWGALALRMAGVPERFGFAGSPESSVYTTRVAFVSGTHEVERNLSLVDAATGLTAPPSELTVFYPDAAEHTTIDQRLGAIAGAHGDLGGRPLVVIHPGAGAPAKLWTANGFARVADVLADRGMVVVIVGSPAEHDLVEAIRSRRRGGGLVLDEPMSLGELGALFARSTVAIGVDSGPMHLAAAVGTPTVRLYGP